MVFADRKGTTFSFDFQMLSQLFNKFFNICLALNFLLSLKAISLL